MPTFRVTISTTVQEWRMVEVDAETADEAEAHALERCSSELCDVAPYDTDVVSKPEVVDMALITKSLP
jgi:hypothetical protein